MATAGRQILTTSNHQAFIYDMDTNAITRVRITGTNTMAAYLSSRFIMLDAATSTIYFSELLTGLTWDDLKFAQRDLAGDPWVALAALSSDLWLLGQETSEVWSPSNAAALPIAPRPGSVVPFGCAAPLSPKAVAGTLCWLAQTRDGSGYVVQAAGLVPRIISTPALTKTIQSYSRIDDAVGNTYELSGHVFYMLTFPTANATWVYDLTTDTWCEQGTWISELMRYDAWRPMFHAFCFDKHLVGDFRDNKVYEMSTAFSLDVEGRPNPPGAARTRPLCRASTGAGVRVRAAVAAGAGDSCRTRPEPHRLTRVEPRRRADVWSRTLAQCGAHRPLRPARELGSQWQRPRSGARNCDDRSDSVAHYGRQGAGQGSECVSFNPEAMPSIEPVTREGGVMRHGWLDWLLDMARTVAPVAHARHRNESVSVPDLELLKAADAFYRVSVFLSGPGAEQVQVTIRFSLKGVPQTLSLSAFTTPAAGTHWYSQIVLIRTDAFTPIRYQTSAEGGPYDLDVILHLEATT